MRVSPACESCAAGESAGSKAIPKASRGIAPTPNAAITTSTSSGSVTPSTSKMPNVSAAKIIPDAKKIAPVNRVSADLTRTE